MTSTISPSFKRIDRLSGFFALPFFLIWFIAASSISLLSNTFNWQHAYITYYYGVVPIIMSISTPYWIRFIIREPAGYHTIASPFYILAIGIGQLIFLPAFYCFQVLFPDTAPDVGERNIFPTISSWVGPEVLSNKTQLFLVTLWIIGLIVIGICVTMQARRYGQFRREHITSTIVQPLLKILEATSYFLAFAISLEIVCIVVSAWGYPLHFHVVLGVILNFGALLLPQLAGSLLISPVYLSKQKSTTVLRRSAKWLPLITWGILMFSLIQISFGQQRTILEVTSLRLLLFGAPLALLSLAITMMLIPTIIGIQLKAVDIHTCLMATFLITGMVATWLFTASIWALNPHWLKLSLSLLMFAFKTGLVSLILFILNTLRECGPRPSPFIYVPQFLLFLMVTANSFLHLHGIAVLPDTAREFSGVLLFLFLLLPILIGYPHVEPGEETLEQSIQSVLLTYIDQEVQEHEAHQRAKMTQHLQSPSRSKYLSFTPNLRG